MNRRSRKGTPVSISRLTQTAVAASQRMDALTTQAEDPTLVQDPARMAQFQQKMHYASTAYQFAVQGIKNLQEQDRVLLDLLQDA